MGRLSDKVHSRKYSKTKFDCEQIRSCAADKSINLPAQIMDNATMLVLCVPLSHVFLGPPLTTVHQVETGVCLFYVEGTSRCTESSQIQPYLWTVRLYDNRITRRSQARLLVSFCLLNTVHVTIDERVTIVVSLN